MISQLFVVNYLDVAASGLGEERASVWEDPSKHCYSWLPNLCVTVKSLVWQAVLVIRITFTEGRNGFSSVAYNVHEGADRQILRSDKI